MERLWTWGRGVALMAAASLVALTAWPTGASAAAQHVSRYDRVVLADGPLAFWTFGDRPGSPTAADLSGNGRDATLAACASLGAPGPFRGAHGAVLGSSEGCYATYQPTTVVQGSFTVEAWVSAPSTDKYYRTILSTRGGPGPYAPYEFGFDLKLTGTTFPSGPQLYSDVGDGTQWLSTGGVPFAWAPDAWYLVAVVVTPTSLAFYVDGHELGARALSGGTSPLLFDPNRPVVIGGDPRYDNSTFAPENFDGSIADVALYPDALTATQLLAHFRAAGVARPCRGRGAWRGDAGHRGPAC